MKGGMQNLVKQAAQLQNRMKKLQEELAAREYEGTSGGGVVAVTVNGDNLLTKLTIADDVMKSGDVEMLQDLIVTASNDAIKKAKQTHEQEMGKLTGGFGGMPGLF